MSMSNKKILHVEDDPDFRTYIRLILEDIADIDQASTLKQAQELSTQNQYDVVLLDLTLPDGSGMTILEDFKINRPEIPVVIFSSDSVTDDVAHVTKAFQKGYFSERNLVEAIIVLITGNLTKNQ